MRVLMTAYQEDLLSLDDLRRRMPELRKREQAIGVELSAIQSQLANRAEYLRLAETITSFLARLRATARTLDVSERQRVVRLLVKEILVSNDAIVIRHSIPASTGSPAAGGPISSPRGGRSSVGDPSYLLRKGRHNAALRGSFSREVQVSFFQDPSIQPFVDHPPDNTVRDSLVKDFTKV
jgi:site-specific DNA recombinase